MLDTQFIRENSALVKENMKKKGRSDLQIVDELLTAEKKWREGKGIVDDLRRQRNELTAEITQKKKVGQDASAIIQKAKDLPQQIKEKEAELESLRETVDILSLKIPNIMHPSVPLGKDDSENVEIKRFGDIPSFKFPVKSHVEIAEMLGIVDFDSSARVSGNGFYYIQGELAILNQAILRFAIDMMVSKGFLFVETPLMLRGDVITRVTDLNDMKNQIYKIDDEDLYLIGTSEHSLIGRYIDQVISEDVLPVKQTSYSMCFRKEIGSHGIDEKGVFRSHQFNKIEMVVICHPKDSMKFYEELKKITVEIFTSLGVPVRELAICSGDLGDLKHVQVDIEAWSPRKDGWIEVGSCSNLTDAQARRLNIRVASGSDKFVPHTLNNTAVATSRAMVAILENYQQKDGSVKIPKVLWKYCGFKKIVPKAR